MSLWSEFKVLLRKEWTGSETTDVPPSRPVALLTGPAQPIIIPVAGSILAPIVEPTDTIRPSIVPGPRPMSVIAQELEAAVGELEALQGSGETMVRTWLANNAERIRAMAHTEHTALLELKTRLVHTLKSELTESDAWVSQRIAAVRALL